MKKLVSVLLVAVLLLGAMVLPASARTCVKMSSSPVGWGMCYKSWKGAAKTYAGTALGGGLGLIGGPLGVVMGAIGGFLIENVNQMIDGDAKPTVCVSATQCL